MFDLKNAKAEYINQNRLVLNRVDNKYFTNPILAYLKEEKELESYKIARFVKLDSTLSMYLEWLYQFHNLQNNYELMQSIYIDMYLPDSESKSPSFRGLFEEKFLKKIWPKIILNFQLNLDLVKQDILLKYPYLVDDFYGVDAGVYDYAILRDMAVFQAVPKEDLLVKSKNSLSYLKIALPLQIGMRVAVMEDRNLDFNSFNWGKIREVLQGIGLMHHVQNDHNFIKSMLNTSLSLEQKVESELNNIEAPATERQIILDQLYRKNSQNLKSLKLLEEHSVLLENILNWCYSYKDSTW